MCYLHTDTYTKVKKDVSIDNIYKSNPYKNMNEYIWDIYASKYVVWM